MRMKIQLRLICSYTPHLDLYALQPLLTHHDRLFINSLYESYKQERESYGDSIIK